MKKLKTLLFLTLIGVLNIAQINAQSTVPGNASGFGLEYGGWDGAGGTTAKDYDLRNYHQGFGIRFFTTLTGGTLTQRATILDNGNLGIGISAPNYLLHQHVIGNNGVNRQPKLDT